MITKGDEGFDMECDCCGEVENFPEAKNFLEAAAAAKTAGWANKKVGGQWMDLCPNCVEHGV